MSNQHQIILQPPASYPAWRAALARQAEAEDALRSAVGLFTSRTESWSDELCIRMVKVTECSVEYYRATEAARAARTEMEIELAASPDAPIAEDDETTVPAGIKITQINTPGGMLERGLAAAIPIIGTEVQP